MRKIQNAKGMGLTELMVSLGVLAIIVAGFSSYMGRVSKFQLSANNLADITVIKSEIAQSVSCDNTFTPSVLATCQNTGSLPFTIPLYSSSNTVIVSDGVVGLPTVRGNWTLRAQCVNIPGGGGQGLEIRAAQPMPTNPSPLTNQGSFNVNPMLKTPYDWANPGGVVSPASSLCASKFSSTQPSSFTTVNSVDGCGVADGASNPPQMVYAYCPQGYLAMGCSYMISQWNPPQNPPHVSNAPDSVVPLPDGTGCRLYPGTLPGTGVCFQAIASCLSKSSLGSGP